MQDLFLPAIFVLVVDVDVMEMVEHDEVSLVLHRRKQAREIIAGERVDPIIRAQVREDLSQLGVGLAVERSEFLLELPVAPVDVADIGIRAGAAGEELREIYMKVESKLTPQLPDLTPPPSTEENGKEVADGPSK